MTSDRKRSVHKMLNTLNLSIQIIMFITMTRTTLSIKCYQCTTMNTRECLPYNLNEKYLKDCANRTEGLTPVCRSLSQVQFFTPSREFVIIRECAYVYTPPLKCEQSKMSSLHYSSSCECGDDGCNSSSKVYSGFTFNFVTLCIYLVIK